MLQFGNTWKALTAAYCGILFFLSAQPHLGEHPPWWLDWPNSDKFVHICLYGGLAGLVAVGLIWSNGPGLSARALFGVPVTFATLYGASDEAHQWFVPPRSCDFFDLCADAAGAAIIAGLVTVWRGRFGTRTP